MEVDDSLWEKQVVGRGDAGDKNDKNENAPLDANGLTQTRPCTSRRAHDTLTFKVTSLTYY